LIGLDSSLGIRIFPYYRVVIIFKKYMPTVGTIQKKYNNGIFIMSYLFPLPKRPALPAIDEKAKRYAIQYSRVKAATYAVGQIIRSDISKNLPSLFYMVSAVWLVVSAIAKGIPYPFSLLKRRAATWVQILNSLKLLLESDNNMTLTILGYYNQILSTLCGTELKGMW